MAHPPQQSRQVGRVAVGDVLWHIEQFALRPITGREYSDSFDALAIALIPHILSSASRKVIDAWAGQVLSLSTMCSHRLRAGGRAPQAGRSRRR
jgi:hypothetical protein